MEYSSERHVSLNNAPTPFSCTADLCPEQNLTTIAYLLAYVMFMKFSGLILNPWRPWMATAERCSFSYSTKAIPGRLSIMRTSTNPSHITSVLFQLGFRHAWELLEEHRQHRFVRRFWQVLNEEDLVRQVLLGRCLFCAALSGLLCLLFFLSLFWRGLFFAHSLLPGPSFRSHTFHV